MSAIGSVLRRLAVGAAVPLTIAAVVLTAPAASAETSYTLADVHKHASTSDCWSVVNGSVYDLTNWIYRHEGGSGVIKAMCGRNGSASYNWAHGRAGGDDGNEPARALARFRIGAFRASGSTSTTPAASAAAGRSYTMAQVRSHGSAARCWSVVSRNVYNLTSWIDQHPGGASVITAMCGRNSTAVFTAKHGGNAGVASILADYKIGRLA